MMRSLMGNLMRNLTMPSKTNKTLVACFPKSGSSYVSGTLAAILGTELLFIAGARKNKRDRDILLTNEQALTYVKLNSLSGKSFVSQAHCVATDINIGLIKYFDIKTIVLVRNIFDVCFSLRDHILNDVNRKQIVAVVSPEFPSWPEERQLDFIVDMYMPWYIKFYISWYNRSHSMFTYESMVSNQVEFFKSLLEHCNLDASAYEIESKLNLDIQPKGRLNKGVVGRGEKLSQDQRNRVLNLMTYNPEVNFDLITR